jgi:tripartite-type tricarboxylate transporter receptor subunit TctC
MRSRSPLLLAVFALVASLASAAAQTYPDRPIKVIVPIGPAGSYDIVGRLLADQLSKRLGQSAVVENRPGAGTIVGTQAVINAPPDGYTLLIGGLSNIVFNAGLCVLRTSSGVLRVRPGNIGDEGRQEQVVM